MIASARRVTFEALLQIETGEAHSDDLLHSEKVCRLEQRDRNLTTELLYGILRWRNRLDYVLSAASSRPWEGIDVIVRSALRIGLYQIWHMDRVPDYAAVSDAVEIARSRGPRGSAGFVNAILRTLCRERPWLTGEFEAQLPGWVRVSLPEWLWARWSERYGEKTAAEYALSLNQPSRTTFRWLLPDPQGPKPGWVASEIVPGAFVADGRAADLPTDLLFMDEASQLVPYLMGAEDGWKVWDACAAPGGKSAILRELVAPGGKVTSSDSSIRRTLILKRQLGKAGAPASMLVVADAGGQPPFRVQFDGVLVDAPCSGLGTLRRNPEIKWRFREDRLAALHDRQLEILNATCEAVMPGGRLLYATCSTEPEENEMVVAEFLEQHPDFSRSRPDISAGAGQWVDANGFFRTFPTVRVWDGFFAALLMRHARRP